MRSVDIRTRVRAMAFTIAGSAPACWSWATVTDWRTAVRSRSRSLVVVAFRPE